MINVANFLSKINKSTPDNCWEWTGYREKAGYGEYNKQRAHRLSYIIHKGEFPTELCVLHKCDNPPCVNPEHLFLGDRTLNAEDRQGKGRTRNGRADLTHCKNGHEFTSENTRIRPNGNRLCRICIRTAALEFYHRNKKLKG